VFLKQIKRIARAAARRGLNGWRRYHQKWLRHRANKGIRSLRSLHNSIFWGDRLLTLDKACGFKSDPAFMRTLQRLQAQQASEDGPDGIAWRLNTLTWAARRALKLGGDFVECGVYKGDMSWFVAEALGAENIPHFYLYDSFSGFSPNLTSPGDFGSLSFMDFANRVYQEGGLYESVVARFSPYSNFTVIKGFLPDSLHQTAPSRIGYLHLDLNSANAEAAVLDVLFDRVVPGAAIICDDFGWLMYKNSAVKAFMQAHGHEVLEIPTGQGLVIKGGL
jgi:O-methyltransferase